MDTNNINKMNTITTDIKRAIINAHRSAEYSTHTARGGMERAINDRIKCAALVEKAKAINKDINGLLSDTELTAQQIKAYLSLHDAAKKRPAMNDKRQLLLCGILETAEMPAENTEQTKNTQQSTSKARSAPVHQDTDTTINIRSTKHASKCTKNRKHT